MLCSLWPSAILAEDGPAFSLSVSNPNPAVGEEIEVEIKAEHMDGMSAFELNLLYDPQLWETSGQHGVQYSSALRGFNFNVNPELLSEGHLRAVHAKFSNTTPDHGTVILGKVKLTAKASGADTLTLSNIKMEQANIWTDYMPNFQSQVVISAGQTEVVQAPVATPAPGQYSQAQSVTLSTATPGAEIYYTINGNEPDPASTKYTGAITVSSSLTIKAIAIKNGEKSQVASFQYVIQGSGDGNGDGGGSDSGSESGNGNGNGNGNGTGNTNTGGTNNGTKPKPSTGSKLEVKATSDANGTAQVKVDSAELQGVIDQAGGNRVSIAVQSEAGTKKVGVDLPMEQIRYAKTKKVHWIGIENALATVTLDLNFLQQKSAATSSSVQLSVSQADLSTLPAEARERIGANTVVYDLELKLDGKDLSPFKGKEVAVEIPYTLKPGESPSKVVIYSVSGDGQLEVVKNAKYDPATGKVSFNPDHTGKYFAAHVNVAFSDMSEAEWAREAVEALAARHAVNGVGDGQFDPNGEVTRAQFITMLVNLFDLADASAASSLSDVQEGAWYYAQVAAAQKLGIIEGKENGAFGVNDNITRQDMAVMMYRAAKALGIELKPASTESRFADQASIAGYASEAVAAMQQAGIVNGIGEGVFAPQGSSTRAQAAAVLYRIFGIN